MSKLFVSQYDNNGMDNWGLFYEDERGRNHLTEDFKPLVYDTEEEALNKLETFEAERHRENVAKPFSIEEAKCFAENHKWKYAVTYAKTAPHEYLVKKWLSEEDRLLFERLVQTINTESVTGYFYGHKNKYLILGDHYYWYMPVYPENMAVDLINRTTTDYLEYRDGAYYYKTKVNIEESTDGFNRQ